MGHSAQVHDLLRRGGGQQGKASAADTHHVGVVSEDGQGVGGESAGGDMEHARQHLAGDLVHIGDHQQQALGGSVSGSQSAGLERAVDRAGGTALRLHFDHLDRLAEKVFLSVSGPLVHILRHGRGGRDGEDARHFREGIGDVRRCLVAVHDFNFCCHTISPLSGINIGYSFADRGGEAAGPFSIPLYRRQEGENLPLFACFLLFLSCSPKAVFLL